MPKFELLTIYMSKKVVTYNSVMRLQRLPVTLNLIMRNMETYLLTSPSLQVVFSCKTILTLTLQMKYKLCNL